MTTTAPKITFGQKSVSANYISNPQISSTFNSAANQALLNNYYDKPINSTVTYQNAANQVIVGQPIQAAAPPPLYQYRSTNADPRVSNNIYSTNQRPNLPVTVSTVIKEPVQIEETQRPKYNKINSSSIRRQTYSRDPQDPLCSPCCWVVGILIGLALISLALLYGLGVIGGPINNPNNSTLNQTLAPAILQISPNSSTNNSTSETGVTGSTGVSALPATTPIASSTSPNSITSVDPIVVPPVTQTSTNTAAKST